MKTFFTRKHNKRNCYTRIIMNLTFYKCDKIYRVWERVHAGRFSLFKILVKRP